MAAFDISVHADTKAISKKLGDLAYRQMPFATAQALTAVAREVSVLEKQALPSIFDKPTPFTQNAIGVIPARKDNHQAVVFMKDITAAYLAPYEFGGKTQGVGRKDVFLQPANVTLNQYGNLPKSKLAQLKANPRKYYFGKIKGKSGQEINGVWQRIPASKGKPASLKLIVKFTDPHEAKQHIDWFKRAGEIVQRSYRREFGKALARAMATAK